MTAVSSIGVQKLPVQPFLGFVATFLSATGAFPRVVRGSHSRHPTQHHSHHHVRAMSTSGNLRYPDPVIFKAKQNATAAIFMLHGLGDTAGGWSEIADDFQPQLPHANFIFPNAPTRPVTLNYGMTMPGWYDIDSLDKINAKEDEEGLKESLRYIETLVQQQVSAGIPSKRIIVAGFSQGGAMSLMLLRSNTSLGGIAALSGYLPLAKEEPVFTPENKDTPIAMFHGDADQVVFYKFGKETAEYLKGQGLNVEFKTYQGMGHSARADEMRDFLAFLKKQLPPT